MLVDQGVISEAEMIAHPERNKIYGCLGGRQTPEIEYSRKTTLEAGDLLILCTDGVWSACPGDMLAAALQSADLMRTVPTVLNQAETRGGPTAANLSIIAVRWGDTYTEDSGLGSSGRISTKTMPRDTVTTRLDEFGRHPNRKTDLSDEEIERAIEEIRSTIQKYSK